MDTADFRKLMTQRCPIYHTINLLGDVWILGIIRATFMGVKRFDEFQNELEISRSVLITKLNILLENGVLTKQAYRKPKQRTRFEYTLTKKGKDLALILGAMLEWGNEYLVDKDAGCMEIVDRNDGAPLMIGVYNREGQEVDLDDVTLHWKSAGQLL